jgi:pyridoxal 5'-phosphate synthase pdxS subunit
MGEKIVGTDRLKRGFATMQKGGVIMDVVNADQAKIAEDAGAVAVMALHAVPADIRAQGGVARMADPEIVQEIMAAVTIPVMAKVRIGHFAEARVLEALGVDMIDESEVLTPADTSNHVDKKQFTIPFVCGARNLGEALRRIEEGAAMIRTKGEAGTGNIVEAVKHIRTVNRQIAELRGLADICDEIELVAKAREHQVSLDLVKEVAKIGRLPVVNFAAGGIATPADASLCMQLGVDGVFVGSGVFKSETPEKMAKAIVEATHNYKEAEVVLNASKSLGKPMKGLEISTIPADQRLQERGV